MLYRVAGKRGGEDMKEVSDIGMIIFAVAFVYGVFCFFLGKFDERSKHRKEVKIDD